jgi:hypothetical protein
LKKNQITPYHLKGMQWHPCGIWRSSYDNGRFSLAINEEGLLSWLALGCIISSSLYVRYTKMSTKSQGELLSTITAKLPYFD